MTRTERLLREMKTRGGMTRKEITQYLLDLKYGVDMQDASDWPGYWNAQLYGTPARTGVLDVFCEQSDDGVYTVVRKVAAPFTSVRKFGSMDWRHGSAFDARSSCRY